MILDNSKAEYTLQQTHVLRLLEGHVKQQEDEFATVERKAQAVMTVGGLITVLVGLLNLQPVANPTLKYQLLIVVLGLYFLTFLFALLSLRPMPWEGNPILPTWTEIERVLQKSPGEFYDHLVASYTNIIERNGDTIQHKAQLVRLAFVTLALDIVVVCGGLLIAHP